MAAEEEQEKPVPAAVTPVEKPAPLVEVVMYNLLGANWKTDVQGIFLGLSTFGTVCIGLGIKSFHELFQFKTIIAVVAAFVPAYVGKKQMDAQPK